MAHGLASLSQRLCSRYVQIESWANRLHAARIGSYLGWPPLCCVRTVSPTSRTTAVQGREDFVSPRTAMAGTAVTFLSVTLAHVILRLRVAREIIGFLSVTDTYIQTISEIRCRISCLALRRSAIIMDLWRPWKHLCVCSWLRVKHREQ